MSRISYRPCSQCWRVLGITLLALGAELHTSFAKAEPGSVAFSQAATSVAAYDFLEVTVTVGQPDVKNPFVDASVSGQFSTAGAVPISVAGFCDSPDGSIYRIRFMPARPGQYRYTVTYQEGAYRKESSGTFEAVDSHRNGVLRVDASHPWHFVWEGTGEHYFWNGTTAFFLMAWTNDDQVREIIERLHALKVNRIRALLAGRWATSAGEPVVPEPGYSPWLNPWVAARPESADDPGFDYTRFNVAYYQRWDRIIAGPDRLPGC